MGQGRSPAVGAREGCICEALARADLEAAATLTLRGYGPEIAGYLRAVIPDPDAADEAFSQFCEFLWQEIAGFRGESSMRTWIYRLAIGAVGRWRRDPFRARGRRLETSEAARLAYEVSSALQRHAEVEERIRQLRAELDVEEQTLLILRLDREMSWREIAAVLDHAEEDALRKRYERVKRKLRRIAEARGLVPSS